MKIRSAASPSQQSHLIRSGELHIDCPGCRAELELEVPEVRTIEAKAEEVRKERDGERTRAIEAEKRLDMSNARVVQLDTAIIAEKKTVEDTKRDLETARTEAATARTDANAATRKTAMLELSRLVGPGQHQITPAERDTLADLAVDAPKQYEKLVAERAAKYRVATGTDPLLGGDLDNLRIPKDPTPQFTRNLDGVNQTQVPPGAPPAVPQIQQELLGTPPQAPTLFRDLMAQGLDGTKPVNVPTNAVRTN